MAISRRSSSSVRRQPEPGFARVDPLRGRVSEQLQERNQRQSIMSARGRSQALRCPSKPGQLQDPAEAHVWVLRQVEAFIKQATIRDRLSEFAGDDPLPKYMSCQTE